MNRFNRSNTINPGNIKLGRLSTQNGDTCKIIFRCRKNNTDYLGQVRLDTTNRALKIELFNENYFSQFAEPRPAIAASLESRILVLIARPGTIQEPFHSLALAWIETPASHTTKNPVKPDGKSVADLQALFDRLNQTYFQDSIQATITWGNGYGKNNRSTIRFGSYDYKNKIIHINPILKREFVPPAVLELTVYHEMCHQSFAPIRKRGKWWYHHSEFKKKEREHPQYREVCLWERQNRRKFLTR